MSPHNHHHSPYAVLPWYLGVIILVGIAAYIAHPLVIVPLLLANVLAMAVTCSITGPGTPPSDFMRTTLHRGTIWLVMFALYATLVWVLASLPMIWLGTETSLVTWAGLVLALLISMAVLWRIWPASGLAFLWDDAYAESALPSAFRRCFAFASHLTRTQHFGSDYLPAALATLVMAVATLLLAGTYDLTDNRYRLIGFGVYAIVVLPVACVVMARATLRQLLPEPKSRDDATATVDPASDTGSMPPDAVTEPAVAAVAGNMSLTDAVRGGHVDAAIALLEAGADPNQLATPDGDTLLTTAALLSDTGMLRALISHGADINRVNHGSTTLLDVTRHGRSGNGEAIATLISNGADLDARDNDGNTALHHAARHRDLNVAADLVSAGARVDSLNQHKISPLAMACTQGHWNMVEWLLQHGALPDLEDADPALLAASSGAHDDVAGVRLLIDNKANVDAVSTQGRSALMLAAQEGHTAIAMALLAANANPDLADQHGITALMEAARCGAAALTRELVAANADITLRDRHGRDALMLACMSTHPDPDTIQALLDGGADPHAANEEGRNALECAIDGGHWDLIGVLDPEWRPAVGTDDDDTRNPEASTPAHLLDALRFRHWNIADELIANATQWPESALADTYVALASTEHARARDWLLDHGLAPGARTGDHHGMLVALSDDFPESLPAFTSLLAAGASPAGGSILARAMDKLIDQPEKGLPLARRMLAAGADPFGSLVDGRSPLHLATAEGWHSLLKTLLDAGVNPNVRDQEGRTPLHAALLQPNPEPAAVRALVAAGANTEMTYISGETPLGMALGMNRPDLVTWLRWNSWVPPHRPLRGEDVAAAANAGDVDAVDKLLQMGFDADIFDARGITGLTYASGRGHEKVALRLLEAGADPNKVTKAGVTPLVVAVNTRQLPMIHLLLDHGADVDCHMPGGFTALTIACGEGHADIAKVLIDAGADVNTTDDQGRSPLGVAAQYSFSSRDSLRCRRLLDTLLKAGADPNAGDKNGMTPLLRLTGAHASPSPDRDGTHLGALLPVLLDSGAQPNHADDEGTTALHACARHALLAPARILLACGANRGARDAEGRRGTDVARQLGYTDVARELDERTDSSVAADDMPMKPKPRPEPERE